MQKVVDEMLGTGNPTLVIGKAKTGGLKLIEAVSIENLFVTTCACGSQSHA